LHDDAQFGESVHPNNEIRKGSDVKFAFRNPRSIAPAATIEIRRLGMMSVIARVVCANLRRIMSEDAHS
jgi:hypothetical protein